MADVYITTEPKSQQVAHLWRTSIQKTVNGKEKRTALFTWPRILLQSTYTPSGSREINWMKRKIIRYSDMLWGIPVWPDKTVLTAQAASGQKILAVADTGNRHFYAGRQCVIIKPSDPFVYAVGTINVLASAQITLLVNLAATWPAGSWVLPLYDCRIAADQEITGMAMRRQEIELEATEAYEAARTLAYTLPASGAPTYLGLDLFLQAVETPVTYKSSRPYDLLQYLGIGYAATRYIAGENALGMKSAMIRPTRAKIWETLNFFDSKQGRLQPYWMPSWSRDIVVTQAVLATDTVLNTEAIEYTTHYLTNEVVGRYVFILFPDGSYACRKITGAGAATVTLDSAIGTAVPAGLIGRLLICFLNLSRFNIDEMAIDYPKGGGEYGQIDLSVMGIVGEAVE